MHHMNQHRRDPNLRPQNRLVTRSEESNFRNPIIGNQETRKILNEKKLEPKLGKFEFIVNV